MQPKIGYITLAVDDLERSLAFYRDGLGWPTDGIVASEFHDDLTGAEGTIAFFQLEGGIQIGLYERTTWPKTPRLQRHRRTRSNSALAILPLPARKSTDCS